MQPSALFKLDKLPMNENSKVDVVALHKLSLISPKAQPVAKKLHSALMDCWQRVLGHAQFSIQDNFFDVGGNSLLSMQLHHIIQKHFKKKFDIIEIFKYPSIAAFSHYLENNSSIKTAVSTQDIESNSMKKVRTVRQRFKRQVEEVCD